MRHLSALLLSVLLITGFTTQASQKRKVLFIGIDGTRSDALQQAHTPHLDSLFATGLSTYDAWCLGITVSGPTWSTMMTGVWFDKHGVVNNTYSGSNFDTYPYFTKLAKQIKPDLYCAEVCEWPPLIDDVPTADAGFNLRLHTPDGQGSTTCATASAVLTNDSIDFMFVYFDQVDLTGHASGFSPTNPSYITAIENVDSCVGVVLNALHNRAHYADEDWLVLVMTDHGGLGTSHGGNTNEERHIWWIANGDNLQQVQPTGVDPGTYNPLVIGIFTPTNVNDSIQKQTPCHPDIAVTALHDLIYDTHISPADRPDWNLDGKSWLMDNSATAVQTVEPELKLELFPNPAAKLVTAYYTNEGKEPVTAALYDITGREVSHTYQVLSPNKLSFDLSGTTAGQYELKLQIGNKTTTRKLIIQ